MMHMHHELRPLAAQTYALCTGLSVRRLARRLTQSFERHLSTSELTLSQFNVLTAIILLGEEATAAEVARQLDADRSTLSRELSLLKERGLIETWQITGRKHALQLSPEGDSLYQVAWTSWEAGVRELEATYGATQMQELQRVLKALLAAAPEGDNSSA